MKKLILIFSILFVITAASYADKVTYVGKMSGIECSGCKKKIASSLGKIKGVKTIRISKASAGYSQLTVVTDGKIPISKAQAISAIKNAEHYKIITWQAK